jgi:UDP-N-acetylglucosamine--N-acetylmuramyl-(pentapeptide) pyrophosphoryl-undecaprenol N-acetylglucosamine transferase
MSVKPILIMAGGTGGHVYPALAVADYLNKQGVPVMWLGTKEGLEYQVVTGSQYQLFTINISGIRGKGLSKYFFAPLMVVRAVYQSIKIILKIKPAVVLGMGGYASGPGGIAAFMTRKPLLIHEQNSVAGLTNRLLAPFARIIFQGFPGAFSNKKKIITTGNPVRSEFLKIDSQEIHSFSQKGKLRLLVLGGSQGARVLNQKIPEAISKLSPELNIEVMHQCGASHIDDTKVFYSNINSHEIRVIPFIEDMIDAYRWADLVICRSGAMTIAEICIVGLASILIPFPYAVDDHQTKNGKFLLENGGCQILNEKDCSSEHIAKIIEELYATPEKLKEMAQNSLKLAKPDATEHVGKKCLEFIYA